MNARHTPAQPTLSLGAPTPRELRGRWLVFARTAWIVVAALTGGLFVASVPVGFDYFSSVCTGTDCDGPQLSTENAQRLRELGFSLDFYAVYLSAVVVCFVIAFFTIAALIFWRRSDELMALYASLFLVILGVVTPPNLDALADAYPTLLLPVRTLTVIAVAFIFLFFFLFPDGRFMPRWTRWAAIVGTLLVLPAVFIPTLDTRYPLLMILYFLGFLGVCVFAQVYRYRRVSGPAERQQTKWVVFGSIVALVGLSGLVIAGVSIPQPDPLVRLVLDTAIYLFMLLIPLSIGVAVVRYRLWDIDTLINRALVYGALTALVIGVYVVVVGGLGAFLQARGNLLVSLFAAGVVALMFAPLRDRLQRGVNRLMYGERDDPYAVISRLGQRLEATLEPHAVLPAVAETVAHALKLPHVAIELKRGGEYETAAQRGRPMGEALRLPLVYGSETIGRIVLSPRAPGESFGPSDRRLLDDLARQVGIAAHAVRLTNDLQRSRERLVTAREEERRRIRRNLHDGLGPALSSAMLKLGAARRLLLPGSPADDLIVEVRNDLRATVADVRGLVYDLRPPALDQRGLVPVIHDYAEQCASEDADGMRVTVDAPEQVPPLPAAVEVAAYYIAREAITNTARHARARSCRVHLALQDGPERVELRLEITDDGVGLPDERHLGVGLSSMRERAEELGGKFSAESPPEGGTRVLARLPLGKE
jgi:signal transduction histidine kinase